MKKHGLVVWRHAQDLNVVGDDLISMNEKDTPKNYMKPPTSFGRPNERCLVDKHDNVCVCISTRLNTSLITTDLSLAKPEFNQQQMVGKSTAIYVFGQIHVSPLIIEFSWKWNIWYDQKKTIWHTKKVTYIMFPTNNDLWLAWLLTCPYDPYVYIHMLSLKKYPHLSIVIPNIPLYLPSS